MPEVHERLLRTFYPDKIATYDNRPRSPARSSWIAICRGLSLEPEAIYKAGDPPPKEWDPWIRITKGDANVCVTFSSPRLLN